MPKKLTYNYRFIEEFSTKYHPMIKQSKYKSRNAGSPPTTTRGIVITTPIRTGITLNNSICMFTDIEVYKFVDSQKNIDQ